MPRTLQTIALFLLFVFSLSSTAEVTLSGKVIENWIASQKTLQQWGDQHAKVLDKYDAEQKDVTNPAEMTVERMVKPLKASGLYDDAKAQIQKHGFSSPEEWAGVTLKIVKAAAVLQMPPEQLNMQMPDMSEMYNSPHISEEQKQMMKQVMEQSMAVMKNFSEGVTEADKAAVEPYLDRIERAMEEAENAR